MAVRDCHTSMLTVSGVRKTYGRTVALRDVSAEFSPGEIHAVLGENGAGKSTLMHILAGFAAPDAGTVTFDGVEIPYGRPFAVRSLGIAMIHQHFTLVPAFTVRENLALAHLGSKGATDMDRLVAPSVHLAERLGWDLDLNARTGSLPVGVRQRIELLKALAGESKVVIFDEPTAVLNPEEVRDLFRVLRDLKDADKTVILIAHKLQEVMESADRVTVLRRGEVVARAPIAEATPEKLALWMVGELPPALQKETERDLRQGLEARDLRAKGDRGEEALRGVSIAALRGEILGIGGVDGNGQVELAEVLAGVRKCSGEILWEGSESLEGAKVAYIPQDRQSDGLALSMSIADNLMIEGHRRPDLTLGPFLRTGSARTWAKSLAERFDVRAGSVDDEAGSLSGGNQQKVVVARALDETPDLLVAVNPSRGLDVKATEYVHRKILEARDAGAAVVLISTDLDELAALASRTVFISRGEIVEGDGAAALLGGAQ